MHPQTIAIRTQTNRSGEMEHSAPLFLTSSFCFTDAETMRAAFADENEENIYSRFSNPNTDEFAQKIALLEGAEAAYTTASGMSAVFSTLMALLKSGDHLVACRALFGSSHNVITKYLPKYGIEYSYVDATANMEDWAAALRPETRLVFIETPTNPALELVDVEALAQLCRERNIVFVVDNCFATPLLQQPLALGAHLVVHSATKWIDGQGRVLGGVIAGDKALVQEIYLFCRNTGPALAPFNAWILSKSLETLDVRMERHCANALWLAEQLQNHPAISWLRYPFLPSHPQYAIAKKQMRSGGGILCFELKGGLEAGRHFLNSLKLLSVTANLGDTRSIASHPSSTTHSKLTDAERLAVGITPGLIRISAGLEHREDVLMDIVQALGSVD